MMTPDPLAPLLKQLDSEIRYRETHGLRDHDTALFRACRLALQQAAQGIDTQQAWTTLALEAQRRAEQAEAALVALRAQYAALDRSSNLAAIKDAYARAFHWRERAEAAEAHVAALTAQIQALRPYVRHKNGCSPRAAYVDDSGTGMEDMSYSVEVPARPCTCGLDALLGATPAQTGEQP